MAVIHVHGAELLMYSRIETQLVPLGHRVQRARPGIAADAPDVCICDVERMQPEQAVAELRTSSRTRCWPRAAQGSTASLRALRSQTGSRHWSTT
jgi:hypothetical protein